MGTEERKTLFIINPKAGNWLNKRQTEYLVGKIRTLFGGAEIVFSEAGGEKEIGNLARIAQEKGFNTIIGRGGDGTLNRIINGLDLNDPSLKVGMIPAGTGNDVTSALGVSWKIDEALLVIKEGITRRIDIGLANGLRFANTVSIGLDALVNKKATVLKPFFQRLGLSSLAYAAAILPIVFGKTKYIEAVVNIDDGREEIKGRMAFLATTNAHRYGRGFIVNPSAKVDDGLLDLCVVSPVPSLMFPYYALRIKKGTHVRLPEKFRFFRFKALKIETLVPFWAQADGEVVYPLSFLEISILPRALNIIVPPIK